MISTFSGERSIRYLRVGTETPFTEYCGSQAAFDRTVAGIKSAFANGVKMAFSTAVD